MNSYKITEDKDGIWYLYEGARALVTPSELYRKYNFGTWLEIEKTTTELIISVVELGEQLEIDINVNGLVSKVDVVTEVATLHIDTQNITSSQEVEISTTHPEYGEFTKVEVVGSD